MNIMKREEPTKKLTMSVLLLYHNFKNSNHSFYLFISIFLLVYFCCVIW